MALAFEHPSSILHPPTYSLSLCRYEFSKLKKFLTQTKFMMEDTLRFLVEESLQRLVTFVCTACSQVRACVRACVCVCECVCVYIGTHTCLDS